jgi:C4-dicarboxylate transporter DctQ subunit
MVENETLKKSGGAVPPAHRIEEWLLALLMAAMTLLTFAQVVLRYAFNSGLIWALEATTYMFGWAMLVGMCYGIRIGAHIGVDLFVRKMPERAQRAVGLVTALLGAGYALILLIGAWHYVDTLRILGIEAEDLPVERWLLLLPLPLAFLLLLWRLLGIAAAILGGRRTGFELADEAQDYVDQFDENADRASGRAGGGVRP